MRSLYGPFLQTLTLAGTSSTTKTPIRPHHARFVIFAKEVQEFIGRAVHGIPNPAAHLAKHIEHPTQLKAHTPAPFIAAFLAILLLRAPFSNGKDQLNGVAVRYIQGARLCHQQIRMGLLFFQLSQQARAVRQAPKQRPVIPRQPAVKRPKPPTFERKQYPYRATSLGYNFARLSFRTSRIALST